MFCNSDNNSRWIVNVPGDLNLARNGLGLKTILGSLISFHRSWDIQIIHCTDHRWFLLSSRTHLLVLRSWPYLAWWLQLIFNFWHDHVSMTSCKNNVVIEHSGHIICGWWFEPMWDLIPSMFYLSMIIIVNIDKWPISSIGLGFSVMGFVIHVVDTRHMRQP